MTMPDQPPRPTVNVEIFGGLGNQLFQAAAGIAVAARTGNALCFDLQRCYASKDRGYQLDGFAHGAEICVVEDTQKGGRGTHFMEGAYHYDDRIAHLSGEMTLTGYFQSPRYFSAVADKVRAIFDLGGHVRPQIAQHGKTLAGSEVVSIHVRLGDYIAVPSVSAFHGNLDGAYYERAIALIRRMSPQATFLVFSDEPAQARALFYETDRMTFIRGNTHFEDMYLMRCCQHHIIANSSFSWWGAWLGQSERSITMAPREWFSRDTLLTHYVGDLFPKGWILI